MRDFSWKYFAMTGDVDAYLLYRQAADMPEREAGAVGEEEQVYDEEAQ
ncbi:YqzL family protein [Paenibacillus sp. HN-1]|nr:MULTISPECIES: YqzL family protein [Paenibacillus]MBY9076918.1 YqzL family protein [Paenibacillus sp. CGMCC 1.18879]MBY9086183.1 YqzL family protein [Paenibacillus sinensis]